MEQSKQAWIEDALKSQRRVPKPKQIEGNLTYSGRVLVRMPKSLHGDLLRRARLEGVSLNHFIVTVLARAIGLPDTS